MKQEFIDFVKALMEAAPEVVKEKMTPEIQAYLDILSDTNNEKPVLTDNGKMVLEYMKSNLDTRIFKARDIAEGLFISSRTVSGALRKLVNDNFVEKMGESPVIYSLTEKGKNFVID